MTAELANVAGPSTDERDVSGEIVANAVVRPVVLDGQDSEDPVPGPKGRRRAWCTGQLRLWALANRRTRSRLAPRATLQGSTSRGPVHVSRGPMHVLRRAGGQAVDQVAELTARADAVTARADEITSRADAITARAEDLAARAEEPTIRIEGLTARIDELQSRLEATGATLAALPALVPSPVPATRPPGSVAARAGQAPSGTRPPWVVYPLPEPGSRVTAGPMVLETRARGEAPITQIRLQLDGVALQVALDRKDDATWRGRATTRVSPGSHTVAVSVVDSQGRAGPYRWQFDAASS